MRPAFAWGKLVGVTEGGREVTCALSARQVEAAMVAAEMVGRPNAREARRARDIEAWRLASAGMTRTQVAMALGCDASTVSRGIARVRDGEYGDVIGNTGSRERE